MMKLIVDWPGKASARNDGTRSYEEGTTQRVTFALGNNVVRHFQKNDETDNDAAWYSEKEMDEFKESVANDVTFFRRLRRIKKKVPKELYEDHVCAWGLEKYISHSATVRAREIKDEVCRSVLFVQNEQLGRGTFNSSSVALSSSNLSTISRVISQEIAASYAKSVHGAKNKP